MTMRVIHVEAATAGGAATLVPAPEPEPGPGQVLVEVHTTTAVDRDFRYAPAMLPPGGVWGFEAGGVVIRGAGEGAGPPPGTRVIVCGPTPGTWARRIAVDPSDLAVVPDGLDLGAAAALGIPGASALQALREFGSLLGRRLLVTGGSGAVAWYAVQLAARAGAEVVVLTRRPELRETLTALGAYEIVTDLDDVGGPVHGVLDVVGGPVLARAVDLLAEGGTARVVGSVAGEPVEFAPSVFAGPRRVTVAGYWGVFPLGADLATLLALAAAGRLRLLDGWRGSWDRIDEVRTAMAAGEIVGKAILAVTG